MAEAANYSKKLINVIVTALIAFTLIPYAKDEFDALNLTGILGFGATLVVTLLTFGAVLYIVDKVL